jgi:hypothetical protein
MIEIDRERGGLLEQASRHVVLGNPFGNPDRGAAGGLDGRVGSELGIEPGLRVEFLP